MPRIDKPLEYGDLRFAIDNCPFDCRVVKMYQYVMDVHNGTVYKYKYGGVGKSGKELKSEYTWSLYHQNKNHAARKKCLKVKIVANYAVEIISPTPEIMDFKKAPQEVIDELRAAGYEPYISE